MALCSELDTLLSPSWEIREGFSVGVVSKLRKEEVVDVLQQSGRAGSLPGRPNFLSLNYPSGPET